MQGCSQVEVYSTLTNKLLNGQETCFPVKFLKSPLFSVHGLSQEGLLFSERAGRTWEKARASKLSDNNSIHFKNVSVYIKKGGCVLNFLSAVTMQ